MGRQLMRLKQTKWCVQGQNFLHCCEQLENILLTTVRSHASVLSTPLNFSQCVVYSFEQHCYSYTSTLHFTLVTAL